jgi:hypothetical protein
MVLNFRLSTSSSESGKLLLRCEMAVDFEQNIFSGESVTGDDFSRFGMGFTD